MSALIALDWGTSSLRAMLMDKAGTVVETRRQPWGIRQLPAGGFAGALDAIVAGWPVLPCIASGMIGSREGWREVAYLDLPAGVDQLAGALDRAGDLVIVPGLRNARGPDVMRGEETQIVGLMARHAAACDATVLLPGTHSKWVSLHQGKIIDFYTLMTGELYALLRQHSILSAGVDTGGEASDSQAFLDGVRTARDSGAAGAFSRLFATRARMLDDMLKPTSIPDYLSGLLIGEEFRSMQADQRMRSGQPLWLIGDEALCDRYRAAAGEFSIALAPAVDDTAAAGLWWLARAAGLFDSSSSDASSTHPFAGVSSP
jgi:2-dehydro-3-deoxygalactonokinase